MLNLPGLSFRKLSVTALALLCLFTVSSNALEPPPAAQDAPQLGSLAGLIVDKNGNQTLAPNATIFICDADTGLPMNRETRRKIEPTLHDPQIDKLWVTEADRSGIFRLNDLPCGNYRLVAQSWSGVQGFRGFNIRNNLSATLILHGIAENVKIKPGDQTEILIRQLGNRTLRIVNDPQEAHALLLVSLKPTLGDGILGPRGWGKEFLRNLIGTTQMEVPHVTIVGLPDDADVHVGFMNYDNSPGVAAGSYPPELRQGTLRIIAGWSNGHKTPPPELVPLTEHLAKEKIELASLLPEKPNAPVTEGEAARTLLELLGNDNDRVLPVPGMGDRRLADILAAYSYLRLQKAVK